MNLSLLRLTFVFLLSFHCATTLAYPEMARTGYVNCNSCHISLNGGGILNDYGRKLSKEELAVWKNEDESSKEEEFAYGMLKETPVQKWLKLGGDVRSVYYYVNTPSFVQGQTLLMQGDLEAAAIHKQWTVTASAGVTQEAAGETVDFLSRTHYIQYEFNDQIRLRGGKFIPTYGINTPDHITLTRDPLELGYNFESYNLEASLITSTDSSASASAGQWSAFLTGIFGRPDDSKLDRDRGFAAQGAFSPTERLKFGLNTWFGKKEASSRWLLGGFAIAGITEALFASTEIDVKSYKDSDHGIATTQKLSYELNEGLWIYGMQEYGTSNIPNDFKDTTQVYGLGFQFFPRTHFEFNIAYEKVLNRTVSATDNEFTGMDTLWLMSHFWL